MTWKVSKKTIVYFFVLIVWLPPESIQYSIPYISYVFMGAQLFLGIYILKEYHFRLSGKVIVLLFFYLLSNCLGMINYGLSIQRIANLLVYGINILSMIIFFQNQCEGNRRSFRCAISVLWILSLIMTFYHYYTTALSTVYGSEVYFWGSRAITVQAFVSLMGLAVYYDVFCEEKISKRTIVLILLSLFFAVIRTSGQGISMFISFLFLLFLNKIRKQKLWKILTPTIMIGIIGALNYLIITLKFQNIEIIVRYITEVLSKDLSLTGRDQIFSGSLKLFSLHPFIGYGYGNQIIYDTLGKIWKAFNTAHNSILQILVDFGILGLGLFIMMFYCLLRQLKDQQCYKNEVLYFILFSMFMGGLVNMIVPSKFFWIIFSLGTASIARNNLKN